MNFFDLLTLLWIRRRLLALLAMFAMLLAGVYAFLVTPRYTGEALILIEDREERYFDVPSVLEEHLLTEHGLRSQLEIL